MSNQEPEVVVTLPMASYRSFGDDLVDLTSCFDDVDYIVSGIEKNKPSIISEENMRNYYLEQQSRTGDQSTTTTKAKKQHGL